MKSVLRKYGLFFIIFLIGLLLLGNIYLINRNNAIIHQNKVLQEDAEKIKVNTVEIIRIIHFLDMTVRGYALINNPEYGTDIGNTIADRDDTYILLESMLKKQNYPMERFYSMRDSVDAYIEVVATMKSCIDQGKKDLFLKILSEDKGFKAWQVYAIFKEQINEFEDKIALQAQTRYDNTLQNSYMLQVLLFFIIVPTLGYTAFYTSKTIKLTERLRISEAHQNEILENQNQLLENRVVQRTNEIQLKNEEIINRNIQLTRQQEKIASQNATVMEQNQKLRDAQWIIEQQSAVILAKNQELTQEVDLRTRDLQQTNLELIEHNSRLEQFTFIISHNLRAPITRLVGLSNILNFSTDEKDQKKIVEMIVKSTRDLDEVIADLNQILGIQKLSMQVYSDVVLEDLMTKVRSILANELAETNCKLVTDFHDIATITTLPQYAESIFYNLISNSLKYRHPDRPPVIRVDCCRDGSKVKIEIGDNGLGIDVERNRHNLFNLYKRFHFHVEGKGLGLYLVKTQVTALGGTIDVQSQPDHGAVFTILLDT